MRGQIHAPAALPTWKANQIGNCLRTIAGPDTVAKRISFALTGYITPVVYPSASHHFELFVSAHIHNSKFFENPIILESEMGNEQEQKGIPLCVHFIHSE